MQKTEILHRTPNETKKLFFLFSVWSFILLCRPQDYFSAFGALRPAITFGFLTLIAYFLSVKATENILDSKQFKLYLLFVAIMIVGIPFSLYSRASFEHVLTYACTMPLFFFLFYQLATSIEKLRNLLFTYCCGVAVYAVYILACGELSGERLSFGTMFDPNDIVFFVISFFTFNLLFITKENSSPKRLLAIVNLMIGLVVIVKTGSRGGLVACLAVCTYLLFAKTRAVRISFFAKAVLVCLAFLSLVPFVNSERYETILEIQDDYNMTDETGRIAIWKIGIRMMFAHPLTGVGVNCFNEGVGRDRERRGLASAKWQSAHNSIIQVGAETGLAGLVVFCLMSVKVFSITKKVKGKSRSEDLIKISEMTRVGFIGHFLSSMFLSQAYSVYWVFYIALSAVLQRMAERERI